MQSLSSDGEAEGPTGGNGMTSDCGGVARTAFPFDETTMAEGIGITPDRAIATVVSFAIDATLETGGKGITCDGAAGAA